MSEALKPEGSRTDGVAFELDHFELAKGESCRLRGRWFGVRGRRFIRPALTLIGEGHRTRLLADLAHKPWAAEDGEPWEAAFPGEIDGAQLLEAELTVAPDITVKLPVPGAKGRKARAKRPAKRSVRPPPDGAQDEVRRLRRRVARAEADAVDQLEELKRALAEARHERDQIAAERDAAQAAYASATEVSEAARMARDRAIAESSAALAARSRALAERDAALAARDAEVAERGRIEAEVAALRAERGGSASRYARAVPRAAVMLAMAAVVIAVLLAVGVV